jgi:hypothetical protein
MNAHIDSALSQHLAVLRGEQLVLARREAQTIYCWLMSGGGGQDKGVA